MYDLINCSRSNEPFAASPCGGLCLHVHGLAFETSIRLLAGSTRYVPSATCTRGAPPARVRAGCGAPTRARAPPGPASRRAPSRFVGGHAASAWFRRLRTPGRVSLRLGGAHLGPGWGPSCPCGVASSGARSPAPGLRRPRPRPGPGGFRRPVVSPRASEERASGRAGGRAAHAGWPPRALARQPPACAVLAWLDHGPASFWFTRSERRRLHASSRGVPLGTVRLRTATRTKACDPSATASVLPLGRPLLRKDTSRLRGGHRSPRARLDATAHRRQDTDAPRPVAGQGLAPSACGAGALAAARGPATVRFAC